MEKKLTTKKDEYIGELVIEDGERKVRFPRGIDITPNTQVEGHFDGENFKLVVAHYVPTYEEVRKFLLDNISWINLKAFRQVDLEYVGIDDPESSEYAIINTRELAELVQRFFIDFEGQNSFPVKGGRTVLGFDYDK